ncbi:GHKL domain-containing protein [Petralouisia muris]|jgi:hypothetical protein|uniref:GHKL domain-containing protein n=1 Tax=Petralouisia muris TaxID=3032872 RepID=A0AC61S0L8_9FIRM|nr:sensor histidine kinase [Petralouisia muris]TGY97465.1 GHKL domain-containing protein [Petralouisia muris]
MSEVYQIPGLILTALCHVFVICHLSELKYSKKRFTLYGCMYAAGFVSIGIYGYAAGGAIGIFAYSGIVICTFLFSCMVSWGCFAKKCFLFITYFCLFSVLDNVLKMMIKLFCPRISAPAGYYAAIVLRSASLLLILALYKKSGEEILHFPGDGSNRRWWNLALVALLFYLLQASLSVLNVKDVISDVWLMSALFVINFIMYAAYWLVFSNINYMKKAKEAALVRQNAEYLSARLSAQQKAEETHRRLRHDIRHHLETIAEYAKTGDTPAILEYIREYSIEVSETAVRQYSVNRTIDSILSVYAGKAKESGIAFLVKCNVPAELAVRDIDLIALLGNLFENALHGCQKSGKENLYIEIYIRLQNSRLTIVCDNICPDGLELSGSLPAGKSIGISSIFDVCRKYGGNLEYKVEHGICSACAVLNL